MSHRIQIGLSLERVATQGPSPTRDRRWRPRVVPQFRTSAAPCRTVANAQRAGAFIMPTSLGHLLAFINGEASRPRTNQGKVMKRVSVIAGVFFALVAAPLAAQAQGVPAGAAHGFHEGNRIAGPVGAVVGTAVGGVIGGVEGVFGIDHRPVAYTDFADAPPPAYRPRRSWRKAQHVRRGRHHRPAAGVVSR
jgi:hypothetical protein